VLILAVTACLLYLSLTNRSIRTHFGCYSSFTAVYNFVNKLFTAFTNLFTLPVVNKSFNTFNGLSRENHFERCERLHRSERFKKIYLMGRSIELY
jgi:hypothetical protein